MDEAGAVDSGKGWHAARNYPPASAVIQQAKWFSLKVNGPGFHLIPCSADLRRLLSYWEEQRGDRLIPAFKTIDPDDVRPLLPITFLVDVSQEPLDMAYRHLGSDIVSRSRGDYAGLRLRDLPSQAPPSQIWRLYEAVVVHQSPHVLFVPLIDHPSLHVEMVAMPLASKDHRVDTIVGGISFDLVYRPYDEGRSQASN